MNPLATLDAAIAPVIKAANVLRQKRDALPMYAWLWVPATLRAPLDALFTAVEAYERAVGRMKDVGLM